MNEYPRAWCFKREQHALAVARQRILTLPKAQRQLKDRHSAIIAIRRSADITKHSIIH
jgi:hypothetical protein